MRKIINTTLLLSMLASCFFYAGKWEDDEDNFKRAFGQAAGDSINVIHSWYWRSPHFTFEHEYFFELKYNLKVKRIFLSGKDIFQIDSTQFDLIDHANKKPDWFTPKDYSEYEIWTSKNFSKYFVFIDKKNNSIYISDYSL